MSLADRYYMREEYHAPRLTKILIAVLLVAFFLQALLYFYGGFDAIEHLGLTVGGLRRGQIWRLLTFQFLHAVPWPWHVLFNCLGLYFFGRPVEEALGGRRFLTMYFLCGVMGGLLHAAVTWLLPGHGDPSVVGASAGVCGMIAIFCARNPMQELTTWIYFFPVTVRARYFLMFLAGLSLFGTLVPFDGVAHAAHLGGILLGLGFVRYGEAMEDWLGRFRIPRQRSREDDLAPAGTLRERASRRQNMRPVPPASDLISREVDPILEKISAQGIHSLTERERKVLEAARKKIR
jgi:membrane associated rhomboid family serine protease